MAIFIGANLAVRESIREDAVQRVATGYGLIEGPVWDPAHGLYFSDVINGGVHLLDRAGQITLAVPKRRGIGGMALHDSGGLVVGGRDIACVSLADGATRSLLSLDAIPGSTGFNDLTTDAAGRIYVGSLAFRVFGGETPKPGHLHVIDLDGGMRTLSDGVLLTNGLGFSPDGKRLYHSDARAPLVRVYDVAPGRFGRTVAQVRLAGRGRRAGRPRRWRATARSGSPMLMAAALPYSTPTAAIGRTSRFRCRWSPASASAATICSDLYIVTGSRGGPHENCGSIFRLRVEVAGLALPVARVSLGGG